MFGDPQTDESRERLKAFVASTDGFELAETDFRLRGPGDIFGTKQHGLPPLRIADLLRDQSLLEEARRDAHAMVTADPGLVAEEHAKLRRMMLVSFQFQGGPKTGVFLVGHGAANAERLLAKLAIDHGVGKAEAGMLGRIEPGQGFGGNQRL